MLLPPLPECWDKRWVLQCDQALVWGFMHAQKALSQLDYILSHVVYQFNKFI